MTGPGTDDVVALTQDLIRIDSSNPDLTSGGAGESAIADHVISWLDTRGFLVRRLEETAGRPSVLAVAPGTGGGRSLMLNGHLDTVSLTSYKNDPLDPVVVDGNLYGRGSYDMLSGIAAMMVAAHRAHRSPHAGDIVLALVADEEAGSLGTAEVLRHIRTDAAIVCEPSGLDLTIAHRGFVWAEVTIHGRAAHGSRPDLGIDAITRAGGFLTGLHQLADELSRRPPHPLLGHGNVHAGVITGGQETSSYPEQCTITIERRTLPGENAATVRDELNQLLRAALDGDIDYDLTITVHREPFAAGDATSDIVTVSSQMLARHLDREPLRRGEPFWTDCALLAEAGIDTVLFGVDGGGAHAATEWVTIDSLLTLVATLTEVIGEYTGPTRPAEPPGQVGTATVHSYATNHPQL